MTTKTEPRAWAVMQNGAVVSWERTEAAARDRALRLRQFYGWRSDIEIRPLA